MQVTLYVNQSDPRKVSKSLITVGNYEITLKADCSIQNPVLLISDTTVQFERVNYAYIPNFNRYYYVDDITFTPTIVQLKLRVDVLMSNRYFIKGLNTYVDRQENLYNLYIADPKLPVRTTRALDYLAIGSLGNDKTTVLTVIGGAD